MEKRRKERIDVVELFAGVGGFRLGLENCDKCSKEHRFNTVWANQWEPGKKNQWAFRCYVSHFGESKNHVNEDIEKVWKGIPKHRLLVGGFPCQDYSVANSLVTAKGIEGKKGVLWWDIDNILLKQKPEYVLLENVDRLLRSPAKQRGRDFGIILRCFHDAGYAVEWRVVNAADYGEAQKRRRTFIFAWKTSTPFYRNAKGHLKGKGQDGYFDWLTKKGFFAKTFPVKKEHNRKGKMTDELISLSEVGGMPMASLADFSDRFKADFYHSGLMIDGMVYSEEYEPDGEGPRTLASVMEEGPVDESYYITDKARLEKWKFLKGAKHIERKAKSGFTYTFSEGKIPFPDNTESPSRTMLTSESSFNRTTHIIEDSTGKIRLLTPLECERLDDFDDGWTGNGIMPESMRYFCMGNALVVGLITKMGKTILRLIDNDGQL